VQTLPSPRQEFHAFIQQLHDWRLIALLPHVLQLKLLLRVSGRPDAVSIHGSSAGTSLATHRRWLDPRLAALRIRHGSGLSIPSAPRSDRVVSGPGAELLRVVVRSSVAGAVYPAEHDTPGTSAAVGLDSCAVLCAFVALVCLLPC
jgi:hypothetical protein